MNVMKERYQKEVVPALMKELNLKNVMQVPRINKVVVNIGLGEALDNPKSLEAASGDLAKITGQKPVITKARRSIAAFKLREGRAIGTVVTLRGEKMWAFLDRVMNIVLPRVRDFRGVSAEAFDGRGHVPRAALEVDIAILLLVTSGDAARSYVTLVVAAAGLALAFGERLDRLALPQRRLVDQDQAATGRAGRVVVLECHGAPQIPLVTSIDWPSARRTTAFLTSERR